MRRRSRPWYGASLRASRAGSASAYAAAPAQARARWWRCFSSGPPSAGARPRQPPGRVAQVAMLFRLVDAYEGCVRLGGVDIATMGLQTLRRHLAVIPQVPLLMDGSIRLNLDPFGAHSEQRLAEVGDHSRIPPLSPRAFPYSPCSPAPPTSVAAVPLAVATPPRCTHCSRPREQSAVRAPV